MATPAGLSYKRSVRSRLGNYVLNKRDLLIVEPLELKKTSHRERNSIQ